MQNVPTGYYPYTNLVFEGGGVKGVAYGGVLEVLEQSAITPQIVNVAGTSAGAITATLVSLNYAADEFIELMMNLDFSTLEDGIAIGGIGRLLEDYGWYKGDVFLSDMEKFIAAKTGSGDGRDTFRDLQGRGFKSLRVFATNLSRQTLQQFSFETTPDVAVADAVRMSMSIPFFFEARTYKNDVYCDGGVLDNYPIWTYDATAEQSDPDSPRPMHVRTPNPATLGFHLGKLNPPRLDINHLTRFAAAVFDALLDIQDILLRATPGDYRRTVFIDTLGVNTTDFHITTAQKVALVEQGRIATADYLGRGGAGKDRLPDVGRLRRPVETTPR
ncbi:MAG TPA: patatin-like phospholipase family protein [Pyrinomonadaceae bacterium]|nr:patatin-like phospholipase family protein [Pyrinomonadaceae bacterium]